MKNNLINVEIKNHKDKNGGHPHVILENYGRYHVSVGLTTQKKKGKKGSPNYELEKNPFNDGKKSYMRRQGCVDYQYNYFNRRTGVMTKKDYCQAQLYGKRAKDKFLTKKR